MVVIAASVIAVFGTLLGAGVTHLFQRNTLRRTEENARSEKLRQERIDAYCVFGGALANYRRGQMDHWFAGRGGDGHLASESEVHELRRAAQRLRAAAMEAMFRAELLTDSSELTSLGREALKAADGIDRAASRAELDRARDESRRLIYGYMAAARPHVPGLSAARALDR
ncbi:hypothetical protein [Streptomyces sp. UH6]|uniref:hypothetical protein n=1 Tax=Streptomyces sp. UH6 TaxID=2748379 RepID=UPI0015D4F5A1|nr:hypothetical protein [Streptomyces sp. UH6]NYV74872.1 hypothetical protein [Streptomyces sp. UH6]